MKEVIIKLDTKVKFIDEKNLDKINKFEIQKNIAKRYSTETPQKEEQNLHAFSNTNQKKKLVKDQNASIDKLRKFESKNNGRNVTIRQNPEYSNKSRDFEDRLPINEEGNEVRIKNSRANKYK